MKDLIIGTNSAVEVLETGGVDEEYSSGNGPSEGGTDVLKEESLRDPASAEFGDRVSKADTARPIARHHCLFRFDKSSACLQEVRLVPESLVSIK